MHGKNRKRNSTFLTTRQAYDRLESHLALHAELAQLGSILLEWTIFKKNHVTIINKTIQNKTLINARIWSTWMSHLHDFNTVHGQIEAVDVMLREVADA